MKDLENCSVKIKHQMMTSLNKPKTMSSLTSRAPKIASSQMHQVSEKKINPADEPSQSSLDEVYTSLKNVSASYEGKDTVKKI